MLSSARSVVYLLVLASVTCAQSAGSDPTLNGVLLGEGSATLAAEAIALGLDIRGEIAAIDAVAVKGTEAQLDALRDAAEELGLEDEVLPMEAFSSGPSSVPTINPAGAPTVLEVGGLGTVAAFLSNAAAGFLMPTTVAVIDTGVDASHPLLANRIHPESRNWVEPGSPPLDVANGIDDDGDGTVDPAWGHGTHLAGLVVQLAPSAEIMALRVIDDEGRGDPWTITAAIVHAVEHDAHVINLSLGLATPSPLVARALDYAADYGVVVVTSAGNDACAIPSFPSGYGEVLSIAATETAGPSFIPGYVNSTIAPYSNFGFADFGATGSEVIGPFPGGIWAEWDGTSVSAAIASGTIAAMMSLAPGLDRAGALSILQATSDPISLPATYGSDPLGSGRIHPFFATWSAFLQGH